MDKELEKKIKEYVDRAVIVGRSSTSDLADMLLNKMDKHIQLSVKKHVNGDITLIKHQLEEYVESDNKWKRKYEPYLEGLANISGSAKIVVWLAISLSSIAGAWLAIKNIFLK